MYEYFGKLYLHYAGNEAIQAKVKSRLKFLFTSPMGLAFMLTPKHAAEGYYFDDDQIEILGYAKEFALKINPDAADKIQEEMTAFITKMSTLSAKHRETLFSMSARSYWSTIGRRDFPALYTIAKPISEMICSSATSERTWSTFKFIHSRLRNRLTNERVNKLVFIYTNCVLLDEKDKCDYILEDGAVIDGKDCEEPQDVE